MATFDENGALLTHEVSPSSQNPHYRPFCFRGTPKDFGAGLLD